MRLVDVEAKYHYQSETLQERCVAMNVAQTLEQARDRDAHQLALIFGALRLTYAELDEQSNRVANSLRQVGVGRGDRVGLFLPNCPEWVMSYHGVQKIGAIAVSLSAALQREEVGFMLRDSGAQALVTTADLRGRVPVAEVPELGCIFVVGEAAGSDVALAAMMAQASPEAQAVALDFNDPAAIVYTSGTTGRPKGATLSHGNVLSNMAAKRHYLGIQPQDRLLLFMPLHHCFGQNAILNSGLGAGATVVLHPAFDGKRVLRSIVEDGVTMFFGIPTIFQFLLENATPHAMRSVRYYFSAAANLPVEIEKRWFETFHAVIYQGYGLTETSPFASYNHHRQHKMGSIGTPIEHVDMRIVDVETGCPLGPEERGEIAIRGPNVMLGYWNCPVETAEVIRDGWFHTGDIGRMDAEGYFYIEDRLKDMINVGGLKVYPAEVENVMYQHPAVAEVAVFGAPDSVLGEQVCAHVVLKPDQQVSTQQLLVFCRQQMAAFKVPSRVALVETLPKTPTGKVLKRVLREGAARQAADEMSRPKVSTTPAHDGVTRRTASSIRQWVEDWVVQHTRGDRSAIDLAQTFADYGLDSIAAVQFVRDVGDWLGRELEATLAWNFPTIEAFVAHLVALERLPAGTAQTRQPPTHAAPRAPKAHTGPEVALAPLSDRDLASLLAEEIDAHERGTSR